MRDSRLGGLQNIQEEDHDALGAKAEDNRRKELEAQKARIVAQMVPGSAGATNFPLDDQENIPPADFRASKMRTMEKAKQKEREKEAAMDVMPAAGLKVNGFDAAAQTLTAAFDAKAEGQLFRDPRDDVDLPEAKVFIVSWVDYCNKYGMGYALTDGSVGVHFNDSTTVVLSPDKLYVGFFASAGLD